MSGCFLSANGRISICGEKFSLRGCKPSELSPIRHISDATLSSCLLILRLKLWHATAPVQYLVFGDLKMKRSLIALSVAAAVLAPAAEAAPKVYGKLNLSVESFKDSIAPANDTSRVVSNASRFGVKGEDELTAELSAVYQMEWEVKADSADAPSSSATSAPTTAANKTNFDLTARNRFVGLKHATYGQVKIGQFDSYLKLAEGEADLFNDYFGDMQKVMVGQNRLKNVVAYMSPVVEGFAFNIQHQTKDAGGVDAPASIGSKGGHSASLTYTNEELGLYAALAADRGIVSKGAVITATEKQRDNERAVITYKIADLFLSGVYTRSEVSDPAVNSNKKDKETGYSLGAAYKLDDVTLKAQYGKGSADVGSAEVKTVSAGADYNFTSKTKVFAFYTKLDGKNAVGVDNADQRVLAAGIEHKF